MYQKNISDSDIRMSVRSHMAQYRIDMHGVKLRVFGGTVRMAGEVYRLGGHHLRLSPSVLESFEREIVMTRGVRRTFFEFDNWKRSSGGTWEPIEAGNVDRSQVEFGEEEVLSLNLADELQA